MAAPSPLFEQGPEARQYELSNPRFDLEEAVGLGEWTWDAPLRVKAHMEGHVSIDALLGGDVAEGQRGDEPATDGETWVIFESGRDEARPIWSALPTNDVPGFWERLMQLTEGVIQSYNRQMQRAMTVYPSQFIEHPKWISIDALDGMAAVRLQFLNLLPSVRTDRFTGFLPGVTTGVGVPTVRAVGDKEADLQRRVVAGAQGAIPSDVIERTSHVLEAIARDETPVRREGVGCLEPGHVPRFLARLGRNSIRYVAEELIDLPLEKFSVFFSALELEGSPSQPSFHGLTSPCMAESKRTQKTKPKKGKPVEIPVPKRGEFERVLKRAARRKPPPK
jgi:hypothetical protein